VWRWVWKWSGGGKMPTPFPGQSGALWSAAMVFEKKGVLEIIQPVYSL